jgi:hypothetical protein
MKKTNILLFLAFLIILIGVSSFYFAYYGYEKKVTSIDIKEHINAMLPVKVKSTAGLFRIDEIQDFEIHKDKMVFMKIKYTLKAFNNVVYYGDFHLKSEAILSKENGIVAIRKTKILRTSIDDSKSPLRVNFLKVIDHALQTYIVDNYFQYRQVINLNDSYKNKILLYFLKDMNVEDDYIDLKFGI